MTEHQQIVALVCLDIDLLADIVEDKTKSIDDLRDHIMLLKEKKDKIISDPEHRETRYRAASMLFSLNTGLS